MADDKRPILCLDFDGVLHSYTSPWAGPDVIPDPPVPGAMAFLCEAVKRFRVAIHSSRSHQEGGRTAMQAWLMTRLYEHLGDWMAAKAVIEGVMWPAEKPPAFVTLDDRALTFTGEWPSLDALAAFKPWNRK